MKFSPPLTASSTIRIGDNAGGPERICSTSFSDPGALALVRTLSVQPANASTSRPGPESILLSRTT